MHRVPLNYSNFHDEVAHRVDIIGFDDRYHTVLRSKDVDRYDLHSQLCGHSRYLFSSLPQELADLGVRRRAHIGRMLGEYYELNRSLRLLVYHRCLVGADAADFDDGFGLRDCVVMYAGRNRGDGSGWQRLHR